MGEMWGRHRGVMEQSSARCLAKGRVGLGASARGKGSGKGRARGKGRVRVPRGVPIMVGEM